MRSTLYRNCQRNGDADFESFTYEDCECGEQVTTATDGELLTIDHVSLLLGVERHTVSKMIRAGTIPTVRLGPRTVRIPRWLLMQRLEEMAASG